MPAAADQKIFNHFRNKCSRISVRFFEEIEKKYVSINNLKIWIFD